MKRPLFAAAALAAALVASSGAAVAQAGPQSARLASSSSATTTLTISAADGETWPCGFNPFNPNTYFFSLGMVYEELYYVDSLTSKLTPWLATSYKWSDNATTLTWTIRKGVTFSNGEKLTAADVAYTF